MKTILVTGAAGFIGHFVSERLLLKGCRVVGVDNVNNYYDSSLKEARLARFYQFDHNGVFDLHRIDLQDRPSLESIFNKHRIDGVIHLAAQAGVRYSLTNPKPILIATLRDFLIF